MPYAPPAPHPPHAPRASRLGSRVATAAATAFVLAAVYLEVLGRQLRAAGRSRTLAGLLVASVVAAAGSPGLPPGGAPSEARPPSPPADPVLGTADRPSQLLAGLDRPAEAERGDALRPNVASSVRADAAPVAAMVMPVPSVVRFRPLAGATGVSRFANLSVRFTTAMDRASTEAAFGARVVGAPVAGTYSWAEDDTVLVLDPGSPLPYGARVELSVDGGARSVLGAPLVPVPPVAFTVQAAPTPAPTSRVTASSAWRWPLRGPITQRFGESLTKYGYHYGIDIDGETGDSVHAAGAGRVVVAGRYDDCGGLEVHVDHGDGLVSWYRHLSRIDMAVGEVVASGTIVGLVGNTGCSLGSHLHFAIRQGSTFVDPLRFLPAR